MDVRMEDRIREVVDKGRDRIRRVSDLEPLVEAPILDMEFPGVPGRKRESEIARRGPRPSDRDIFERDRLLYGDRERIRAGRSHS
jgi:hypothetical protein